MKNRNGGQKNLSTTFQPDRKVGALGFVGDSRSGENELDKRVDQLLTEYQDWAIANHILRERQASEGSSGVTI
jgi:hypothetical protein